MKFVVPAALLLVCSAVAIKAQSCLTPDDVKQILARVDAPPPATVNTKLKEDLLKMAVKQRELLQQVIDKDQTKQSDRDKLHKTIDEGGGGPTIRLQRLTKFADVLVESLVQLVPV